MRKALKSSSRHRKTALSPLQVRCSISEHPHLSPPLTGGGREGALLRIHNDVDNLLYVRAVDSAVKVHVALLALYEALVYLLRYLI